MVKSLRLQLLQIEQPRSDKSNNLIKKKTSNQDVQRAMKPLESNPESQNSLNTRKQSD